MEGSKVNFLIVIAICLLAFFAQSGNSQFHWGKTSGVPETEELMSFLQDYAKAGGNSKVIMKPAVSIKHIFHEKVFPTGMF